MPVTVSDLSDLITVLWPLMCLQMVLAVLLAHAVMGFGRALLAFLADVLDARK